MKVHVVYLGPAADWAGLEGETFDVEEGAGLEGLIRRMMEARPGLGPGRGVLRFAVNDEFAGECSPLSDGDQVAVIPPVSGGSDNLVALVDQPIDLAAVRRHVGGNSNVGGIAVFEGVTRLEEHPQRGPLLRLEYQAYQEMAVKEMQRLMATARQRWGIKRSAMVHRIGPVGCGETIVVIVVACGHRAEAFEACRWLIDSLKKDVPIWKKEIWRDGDPSWVDPAAEGE